MEICLTFYLTALYSSTDMGYHFGGQKKSMHVANWDLIFGRRKFVELCHQKIANFLLLYITRYGVTGMMQSLKVKFKHLSDYCQFCSPTSNSFQGSKCLRYGNPLSKSIPVLVDACCSPLQGEFWCFNVYHQASNWCWCGHPKL